MERGRPIEKYGKKQQKEWLDNILPDPNPCTAGNKEEKHRLFGKKKIMFNKSKNMINIFINSV